MSIVYLPLKRSVGTLRFIEREVRSVLLYDNGVLVGLRTRTTGYKNVVHFIVNGKQDMVSSEYSTTLITDNCGELVRSSFCSFYCLQKTVKSTADLTVVSDLSSNEVSEQHTFRNVEHIAFDGEVIAVLRSVHNRPTWHGLTVYDAVGKVQARTKIYGNSPVGIHLHGDGKDNKDVFVIFSDSSHYVQTFGKSSIHAVCFGQIVTKSAISKTYKCGYYILGVSGKTILVYQFNRIDLTLVATYDFSTSVYFSVQQTYDGLTVITDSKVFFISTSCGLMCRTILPIGFTDNVMSVTVGICNGTRYVAMLRRIKRVDEVTLMDIDYI